MEDELKRIEAEYWCEMRDFQALGQLIATKEVELYQRHRELLSQLEIINQETLELGASKKVRADLAMRLGQIAERIANTKVKP